MPQMTVTIPAAGKHKKVQAIGLSVYIVEAPAYASATEAPRLSFDNPGGQYPALLGSIIGSDKGTYSHLVITGTPESAGDEITLLGIPVCLETNLNLPDTGTGKATPGNTFVKTSTDAPQGISELELADAEGNLPRSVYVSASGAAIRYTFNDGTGTDPDQAGTGYLIQPGITGFASGSIEPTAAPAADETFEINFYGQTVTVSALAADTLQAISNKIRDALKGNATINNDFTVTNNAGAAVPVSIAAKKPGSQYNSIITATNVDTALTIQGVSGGESQSGEVIEIKGWPFIEDFMFASASAGTPGTLIITPEY